MIKNTTILECLADFDTAYFHQCVLGWYKQYGRSDLVWRNFARDGSKSYEVYVSEMMLQQTQVQRVLEHYYFPFLRAFPTLKSLANAKQERVLKVWEGLGYYARARNMQKCAHICMQHYDEKLPSDIHTLQELPGIGLYSAGAIACFGFGKSVGFVDSNISRVFCRLFALQESKTKELHFLANTLVSTSHSFEYNQALLDIGALICTKTPKCLICPLFTLCLGKSTPNLYPRKKKSPKHHLDILLFGVYFMRGGNAHFALQQSTNKLYFGLYNLPQIPKEHSAQILHNMSTYATPKRLGKIQHNYTKYTISAEVYAFECENLTQAKDIIKHIGTQDSHPIDFFTQKEVATLPISSLAKKALNFF